MSEASYSDLAADNYLRAAIKKVGKQGKRLCQGACGTYDGCTKTAGKMAKTPKVCPVCACLLSEKESTAVLTSEFLLEEMVAEALGVDLDWVISYLQGFDGDEACANGNTAAFRLGKKLWKDLGEETQT